MCLLKKRPGPAADIPTSQNDTSRPYILVCWYWLIMVGWLVLVGCLRLVGCSFGLLCQCGWDGSGRQQTARMCHKKPQLTMQLPETPPIPPQTQTQITPQINPCTPHPSPEEIQQQHPQIRLKRGRHPRPRAPPPPRRPRATPLWWPAAAVELE